MSKHLLLRALDEIIGDLREATIAIQRDDYEGAIERLKSAKERIRVAGEEIAPA